MNGYTTEEKREYNHFYYLNNRDRILSRQREHWRENAAAISARRRKNRVRRKGIEWKMTEVVKGLHRWATDIRSVGMGFMAAELEALADDIEARWMKKTTQESPEFCDSTNYAIHV